MLAVCHTVMVEKDTKIKDHQGDEDSLLRYSASSPDELALVMGAKEAGIVYHKRTASTISIKFGGAKQGSPTVEEDYEAIVEFPFDSTRKRMSLLVK
jgi:magnesium-transporting ATPase (P-type)